MKNTSNITKQQSKVKQSNVFRKLWLHISRRRRFQFLSMLGLTLVSSVAEVVSLGAIVPFLGILTQPDKVFAYPAIASFAKALGIVTAKELLLPLSLVFIVVSVLAGGLRLALLRISTRLANVTGVDLGKEVYRRTLYQPYTVHISRNSSEIISGITHKVAIASNVLLAIVITTTSTFLFIAILLTLLAIDPLVATVAFVSFGVGYGIIASIVRPRLARNGECIAREQTKVIKALQEGLGAIRDVLLDGTQDVYCELHNKAFRKLQIANAENVFMSQSPRYAIESLGMIIIIGLAFFLSQQTGGIGAKLPVLGALALGAERMLPLMQQIYGNWAVIIGSRTAMVDVLDLLEQPVPEDVLKSLPEPLAFKESIKFDNISFRYDVNSPLVLDNISITIKKGSRIGFIGSTGSGKSTALDLLMSLLEPTKGNILVDDKLINSELRRAWQRTIAHVPQSIFLVDATISENIALGMLLAEIDNERVRQAAKQAQIDEFIMSRPDGYKTMVGERGIRLSGGQRQRVGIARALYKQATVLVFDEATSALDSITEKEVMESIENLHRDLTILIIAHRLTTLQHCDEIIKLEHGKVIDKGSYAHFKKKEYK